MRLGIPFVLLLGTLASLTYADAPLNRMTKEEIESGWLTLFDGESMSGWKANSNANWKVKDGALSADSGEPGQLISSAVYTDFTLRADFRAAAQTNSGIFLRTSPKPKDPAIDCYELNIANESLSPFPTGSLVDRAKATAKIETGSGWHTVVVRAQGGRFRVSVDDTEVLDYTDPNPIRTGHIGLQFNAGPIEFRNLRIKMSGGRPD